MTDYLYATGRLRALEKALIGNDRLMVLLDTKTEAELNERLRECGLESADGDWEAVLSSRLGQAYAEVKELCGSDAALRLWLAPYDCNNVKAAMKGFVRGINPRSMMVDFGSVSEKDVIDMVEKNDYSALSPAMREAAPRAMEEYAKTKNPQVIDLCMDRACYADMLEASGGAPFCNELVKTKIDLINLMSLIRVLRMKSGEAGEQLLSDAWLEGGLLSVGFLREQYRIINWEK